MSLKPFVIALAVLIASGVGYLAFTHTPGQPVGSASSPSIVSGCQTINGATSCYFQQNMASASTTCSFPITATSSLDFAGAKFTNTYGGSFVVEWGKASNRYSTTTTLGYAPGISSGSLGTFIATSTSADINDESGILSPGTYLDFKVGSSSPTLQGTCSAVIRVF